MTLTDDQHRALDEIMAAYHGRTRKDARYLLTGYAGTGKTTLMHSVAKRFREDRRDVVLTAPTHKAVSVLKRKLAEFGIEAECCTIHSLLSLNPKPRGAKTILVRRKNAQPVTQHVVIVDECSMLDSELMSHIGKHCGHCFVLFVGDPAQLPPVNEKESQSFETPSRSHLTTIVRQDQENPVLAAAHVIRESQGKKLDMTWAKPARAKPFGVYVPNGSTESWMQKAFTSDEFKGDNDTFRYLCWTNKRVAEINTKVRRWIYGDTRVPFSVGEMALIRAPIFGPVTIITDDRPILFNTNDEARVLGIGASEIETEFEASEHHDGFDIRIPAWAVVLEHPDGREITVRIPHKQSDLDAVNERLVKEQRWQDKYEFAKDVARLQSVYALTVHNSQGSTFRNVFMDVADIRQRAKSNVLETQQMLYVAATRPTHALMLVGV